jgi:hypothetical protein
MFRGCLTINPPSHRRQLLPIARISGHVIEEDQCVNAAFLMQGVCIG